MAPALPSSGSVSNEVWLDDLWSREESRKRYVSSDGGSWFSLAEAYIRCVIGATTRNVRGFRRADWLLLLGARSPAEFRGAGSMNVIAFRPNEHDIDFHSLHDSGVSTSAKCSKLETCGWRASGCLAAYQ